MKKQFYNFTALCFILVMAITFLCGCGENTGNNDTSTVEISDASLDFTWNPYVFSDIDRETYGEDTEAVFYNMVDAILTGADSFACPDEDTMYNLSLIAQTCFPPYTPVVAESTFSDGTVFIAYTVEDSEREQILNDFEEQITSIIVGAVEEGDSPTMAAIALYHNYAQMVSYDYDAAESEEVTDVSCYRALMELSGICQSFAPAYAYLCLECGIDAVTVCGMTEDYIAHEWTMLKLNGNYYYADPTFENGDGGMGLRYFGMTATEREWEGGFIADEYNIGSSNEIWGRDINVTDETFAQLWNAVTVDNIERKNGKMYIAYLDVDGNAQEYVVESF